MLARSPLERARIIVWKVGERRRWCITSGGVGRSIRGGGPVQVAATIKVFVGAGTHSPLGGGRFKAANPVAVYPARTRGREHAPRDSRLCVQF